MSGPNNRAAGDAALEIPASVLAAFAQHVHAQPNAQVAFTRQTRLSFAALDAQSNRLAHHLMSLGVGPDMPVGV